MLPVNTFFSPLCCLSTHISPHYAVCQHIYIPTMLPSTHLYSHYAACQQIAIPTMLPVNTFLSTLCCLSTNFYPHYAACQDISIPTMLTLNTFLSHYVAYQHISLPTMLLVNTFIFPLCCLSTHLYSHYAACQHIYIQRELLDHRDNRWLQCWTMVEMNNKYRCSVHVSSVMSLLKYNQIHNALKKLQKKKKQNINWCISVRWTKEKQTDNKLTKLVLLYWGELNMRHSGE